MEQPKTALLIAILQFTHLSSWFLLTGAAGLKNILSIRAHWPRQCAGKTAHPGAEITKTFSVGVLLNGKRSVCVCVSLWTQISDKHERYC